jgi:hypothetical protein
MILLRSVMRARSGSLRGFGLSGVQRLATTVINLPKPRLWPKRARR